ncbi:MAG TPA: hypothetical protein PKL21_11855, partial [Anaerolineaceae bacterium]|nr:hypothetical protein [Anaerolineaceae bacterium]
MNKKVLSMILLAVLLLTTLAGCTTPAATTSATDEAPAKTETASKTEDPGIVETPKKDTLTVALPADPPSLDPVLSGGRGCMRVLKQIY